MNLLKNQYILAFLGFIFICYYIWYKFIRERLPKSIPFDLTLITLITLFLLCIIYLYVIIRLINPKPRSTFMISYIIPLVSIIKLILAHLDQVIKQNMYLNKIIEYFILVIVKRLKFATLYHKGELIYFAYILFPQIIVASIFLFDIIYLKKINYFYYCLIINFISIILPYFIYSVTLIKEKNLKILKDYIIEITSEDDDEGTDYYMDPSTLQYDCNIETEYDIKYKYLTIEHFIDLQSTAIMWEDTPYNYKCIHKSERQDFISLSPSKLTKIYLKSYILNLLQITLNIHIILRLIPLIKCILIIKYIQILIYSLYFFGWLYILCTSLFTLPVDSFLVLDVKNICYEEPFSNLSLFEYVQNI